MLTTIKDICEFVDNLTSNTDKIKLIELLDKIISETEKSVERTTFLLPVLKKADVVDAGAQGILDILIGTKKAFIGIGSINGKLERKVSGTRSMYLLNLAAVMTVAAINREVIIRRIKPKQISRRLKRKV